MHLNPVQRDALTELVNIGVGRAAAALSELCGERVEVSAPYVLICRISEVDRYLSGEQDMLAALVVQDFQGKLSGRALLALPRSSSLKLGQLLGDMTHLPCENDLDLREILTEVGNLVLNSVLGSIGNTAHARFLCSLPELVMTAEPVSVLANYLLRQNWTDHGVFVANVQFHVARLAIQGSIMVLFECDGIVALLDSLIAASI